MATMATAFEAIFKSFCFWLAKTQFCCKKRRNATKTLCSILKPLLCKETPCFYEILQQAAACIKHLLFKMTTTVWIFETVWIVAPPVAKMGTAESYYL